MTAGSARLVPFIAVSAALHAAVFVAGPERLTIATAPAGNGHEVSIRLEAAAPTNAAAPSDDDAIESLRRAEREASSASLPPEPEPKPRSRTAARSEPVAAPGPEPAKHEAPEAPGPIESASNEISDPGDRGKPAPSRPRTGPAQPVAEVGEAATGADRTSSPAQRAEARAAIVAELARYFRYPRLAQRRGWEGTVVLTVRILPDGRLDRIGVKRSSGRALLDRAAVRSLTHVERLPRFTERVGADGLALEIPVTYRLESA